MGRTHRYAWLILPCFVLGCTTTPGNRLTLFPEGHRLLASARTLTNAAREPQPLPRELDKHPHPSYQVEPGDVLLVQPADLDSPLRLPGDQPVLPDGTINLGRYGHVGVFGKTVDEIEALVRNRVESQGNPEDKKSLGPISVRIVSRVSKVYYVLGEVNAPGSFTLSGRETVLDGLLAAGGLTDRASRRSIILSRPTAPNGCRIVLPICYREITQLGDTTTNYQLAAGDRIFVSTRTLWEELVPFAPECPPCGRKQVPCARVSGCPEVSISGYPQQGAAQVLPPRPCQTLPD